MICRKEKFVPNRSLTARLLNRNRNAWKLQHYWNKDLTVKVRHSCIELSPLPKCGLETLNQTWNHSQTSGEVQPPCDPKNFNEHNRRSGKWWSLLMITEESLWQSSMWNKCGSSILLWLDAKIAQKKHKNWPDLPRDGPLILHDDACLHLGKVVTDLFSKYKWEVLPHTPYSPDLSPPDFNLFHKLKEPMFGHRVPSLEEVFAAVNRAIQWLKKSDTLNGIINLLKRWDAVIEKRVDYVEGL